MEKDRSYEQVQGGMKTIAVINFRNSPHLIRQNGNGDLRIEYINTGLDKTYYDKEIANLQPNNHYQFPDADRRLVHLSIANRSLPLTIEWAERTSGVDEATIHIQAQETVNDQKIRINLQEQELMDLFIKPQNRPSSATFVTFDSAEQELIAVLVKRKEPILFFIPPVKETTKLSAISGLNDFIEQLYRELTLKQMTKLQRDVDEKVFKAMLENKMKFEMDDSTPARAKLLATHKRLYQIQTLLLALQADGKGTGLSDPDLLKLAPFLQANGDKGKGLFTIFSAQPENKALVKVDNTIWTSLIEKPSKDLIQTKGVAVKPPPVAYKPLPPATRTDIKTAQQPITPKVEPVKQVIDPDQQEKKKAVRLADNLSSQLQSLENMFQKRSLESIGLIDVNKLPPNLQPAIQAAREYTKQRRRGAPPNQPTICEVIAKPNSINFAGIQDSLAYEFMTGKIPDYRAKIDAAFNIVETILKPLYFTDSSRTERKLSKLRANGIVRQADPKAADLVVSQLDTILSKQPQLRNVDINALDVSFLLLSTQVLYALEEQFHQLEQKGKSVEIDNWASYALSTLLRLEQLTNEALQRIH